MEFSLHYLLQRAVKGQALTKFLVDHPYVEVKEDMRKSLYLLGVPVVSLTPWKLRFNRSKTRESAGVEVIIESPQGCETLLSFKQEFECTNNQAEYKALIIALDVLLGMGASMIDITGDSQLVIN